jgi:hypothetical protein
MNELLNIINITIYFLESPSFVYISGIHSKKSKFLVIREMDDVSGGKFFFAKTF